MREDLIKNLAEAEEIIKNVRLALRVEMINARVREKTKPISKADAINEIVADVIKDQIEDEQGWPE